ncbi:MAG TPA: HDIG domain-containing protein [Candidatus Aphodocola excrementigallinarum]|uniref:HDIG domain-containing protein n=1 Tax=Candidatus Aphodocola excrementigallinarum TaxID=2840670 RepID=A0A9D1LIC5_9FIRM|nr:HDIG domain-containing protein [Candidatus Aphodocola excrementigallinarum]
MKLTSEKAIMLLKDCKGMAKNDEWIKHSICIGNAAGVIAKALKLDEEKAKTLGYIHDIGKRFNWNSNEGVIPHAINGYNYLKSLGYDEEYSGICIKHSFLNNDINCLANDRDFTDSSDKHYLFIKEYIKKEYTIYDKIINLCDLMCTVKLQTLEKRIIDLLLRHGVYKNTHYHLVEAFKLKETFDNLLGYNLYNLFPQIKDNL